MLSFRMNDLSFRGSAKRREAVSRNVPERVFLLLRKVYESFSSPRNSFKVLFLLQWAVIVYPISKQRNLSTSHFNYAKSCGMCAA